MVLSEQWRAALHIRRRIGEYWIASRPDSLLNQHRSFRLEFEDSYCFVVLVLECVFQAAQSARSMDHHIALSPFIQDTNIHAQVISPSTSAPNLLKHLHCPCIHLHRTNPSSQQFLTNVSYPTTLHLWKLDASASQARTLLFSFDVRDCHFLILFLQVVKRLAHAVRDSRLSRSLRAFFCLSACSRQVTCRLFSCERYVLF